MSKQQVSAYLAPEEIAFLKEEAHDGAVSVSWLIRFILKMWIRERKEEADEKR